MLCALTVRTLHPGTFDRFRDAFMENGANDLPAGWTAFHLVRSTSDPDEVVTFGFFDGTPDELRASMSRVYAAQQEAIAPFVAAKGTDGLFEVAAEWRPDGV